MELVVYLLHLVLIEDVSHIFNKLLEFVILFLNDFMKNNTFFLSLDSWWLSWNLVPQSLSLFYAHSVLFGSLQFSFEFIYSFLCFDEVQIISFSLSTSSLLSWFISFIFSLVAAGVRAWLIFSNCLRNRQKVHVVVIVLIYIMIL